MELQKLNLQVGRLVSDFESEKEVRKRLNGELEKRVREIELWKSELHGRIVVTVSIAGIVIGAVITLIIKFVK